MVRSVKIYCALHMPSAYALFYYWFLQALPYFFTVSIAAMVRRQAIYRRTLKYSIS